MKFKDYIKLSLSDLKKRKFRTFLTSFAVAIGTMLIVVMVSLGLGIKNKVMDIFKENMSVKSITVMPYEATKNTEDGPKFKKLDNANIEKIKKLDKVNEIVVLSSARVNKSSVLGKSSKAIEVKGIDLNYSIITKDEIEAVRAKSKNNKLKYIIEGKNLEKEDKDNVLVGEKYLKSLGFKDYKEVLGKEITLSCQLPNTEGSKGKDFILKGKVAGVIEEKFEGSEGIVAPIAFTSLINSYFTFDNSYYENKGPDQVKISVEDMGDVKPVTDEIKKIGYEYASFESMAEEINKGFLVFQAILAFGGIIVLFVASLGVINTMTMSIYERTRSIGIMKAVGASKGSIKNIFIFESGVLGFLGGIGGILLGLANIKIIKIVLMEYLKNKGTSNVDIFSIPLWLILGSLGFSILVTVLAGLYPSHKAAKLDPIEALRYE